MSPDPARLTAAVGAAGRPLPEPYPSMNGQTAAEHCSYAERPDPVHNQSLWADPPWMGPRWTASPPGPRGKFEVAERVPVYAKPGDPAFDKLLRSQRVAQLTGIVHSFRHADGKQLCCWAGIQPGNAAKYLKPLHYAGVLERGTLNNYRIAGRLPYLYGMHDGPPARRYFERLDDETALATLGTATDRRPRFSSRHLRHNVAVTETTLRTMEVSDAFDAVDGELRASVRHLMPLEDPERIDTGLAADAIWYRHDGLRVAVELVMTLDRDHIARKMARWASLMADTDGRNQLVVVWLNAVNPDHAKAAATLRRIHADTFEYGKVEHRNNTLASPDVVRHVQVSNVLASWFDWYPQPRQVSHAGRDLYVVGTIDGARWQAIPLTDTTSVPLVDSSRHQRPPHQLTPEFATMPPLLVPEWLENAG